jgi:hypothetical protein
MLPITQAPAPHPSALHAVGKLGDGLQLAQCAVDHCAVFRPAAPDQRSACWVQRCTSTVTWRTLRSGSRRAR